MPAKNKSDALTMTYVKQNPKYPKEVHGIFEQIPEYEFYEPKLGRQWGYIQNGALFPDELELEKSVYIKKSLPPPSSYTGYKYIALCYFFSKNMDAKSKEGNPVYVAHYVLVPNSFIDQVKNFMKLPVYNAIANMTIEVDIERTVKESRQITPIIEATINRDPDVKSTPQIDDPMLHKNKLLQDDLKKKDKVKSAAEIENEKQIEKQKNKEKIKREQKEKAEELKKKKELEKKQAIKRIKVMNKLKKEFLDNMDLSQIFPPHKDKTELIIVHSQAEEASIPNGGLHGGPDAHLEAPTHYFKKDSLIMTYMRKSSFYPPFNIDNPSIPMDAETDVEKIGLALIAKYIPPKPLVAGMKYTYFFLAPAKFNYPGDLRVYIPVYILVPEIEFGRPSDLEKMSFDHYITPVDSVPENKIIVDKASGIRHTIITTKPERIPVDTYSLVSSKFHLDSPMTPLTDKYFVDRTEFVKFLMKHKLVNDPDAYYQDLKDRQKNAGFDEAKLKQYMKTLLYFKSADRENMINDAVARAVAEAKRKRDQQREKDLREKQEINDRTMLREMDEEDKLKQKTMVLNEQLNALRELLKDVNPKSELLKTPLKDNQNKTKADTTLLV